MPSSPSYVLRVRKWADALVSSSSSSAVNDVAVCPPALADRLLASVRTAHQQEKSLPPPLLSPPRRIVDHDLLQETPEFARPAVRALATAAPPATFECVGLVLHVWPASEGCAALARQVRAAVLLARATAPTKNATTVTVHLYLTDLLPTLPSSSSSSSVKNDEDNMMRRLPEHANSGFAYRDKGTIVIYRAFGWFKVLLHELLHALGSDLGGTSTQLLRSDTPVLLYEVYVETWARLLHAAFVVVAADASSSSSSSSSQEQRKELQVLLRDTALFAVHQAIRWTRTSTLEPLLITEGSSAATLSTTPPFHEETSGLSYFVCTAALLCRLPDLDMFTQRTNCFFGCDGAAMTATTTQAQFERLLRSSLWSLRSVWRTVALQPAAPLAFADSMQMTHLTYAPDCGDGDDGGEVRKLSGGGGGHSGTRKQGRRVGLLRLLRLRRPPTRRRRRDAVKTRRRRQRTTR